MRESPSSLDYIATDTTIVRKIQCFTVGHHLGLPDHNCLCGTIETMGFSVTQKCDVPIIKEKAFKYAKPGEFLMKLESPLRREKLDKCLSRYIGASENTIDTISSELVDTLTNYFRSKFCLEKVKEKGNKKVGLRKSSKQTILI